MELKEALKQSQDENVIRIEMAVAGKEYGDVACNIARGNDEGRYLIGVYLLHRLGWEPENIETQARVIGWNWGGSFTDWCQSEGLDGIYNAYEKKRVLEGGEAEEAFTEFDRIVKRSYEIVGILTKVTEDYKEDQQKKDDEAQAKKHRANKRWYQKFSR